MKVEGEDSKEFAARVDTHQDPVLSPFIFAAVMDVVTGGSEEWTCPDVCR